MAIKPYNFLTRAETGTSDWIRLDQFKAPFHVSVTGDVGGGTMTYTVQYTVDDLDDEQDTSATAIALPDMSSLSATETKAIVAPVTGVRVNITAYTSGTFTLKVRQAGVRE